MSSSPTYSAPRAAKSKVWPLPEATCRPSVRISLNCVPNPRTVIPVVAPVAVGRTAAGHAVDRAAVHRDTGDTRQGFTYRGVGELTDVLRGHGVHDAYRLLFDVQ